MRQACMRVLCAAMCLLLLTGVAAGARADYESLCRVADIAGTNVIAWLEIPGASVCEPVMRHGTDDVYYASHDAHGADSQYGTLFVQAGYNSADFSDPVTLIYGSSLREDAPFGMLQQMYSGSFNDCRQIWLHTPDGTREYRVFVAVPYSSIHILHYYDFQRERRFEDFFDDVFSTRALGMHLAEDSRPVYGGGQVLILSTGLRGDAMQRYLVMAGEVSK